MASNLRKFVNPKFLKTCDLPLMQRLLARYQKHSASFDLALFTGGDDAVRDALGHSSKVPKANTRRPSPPIFIVLQPSALGAECASSSNARERPE